MQYKPSTLAVIGTLSALAAFSNLPSRARAQCLEGCSAIYVLAGEAPGDQFGWEARVLGDVDGDGLDDFIVSAPTNDGGVRMPVASMYTQAARGLSYIDTAEPSPEVNTASAAIPPGMWITTAARTSSSATPLRGAVSSSPGRDAHPVGGDTLARVYWFSSLR